MHRIKDLAAFADNLFDGLIEIDSNGKILVWNRGAERITGLSAAAQIGLSLPPLGSMPSYDDRRPGWAKVIPLLETLRDGRPQEAVLSLSHAEGFPVLILARTLPVLDDKGHLVGALAIFSDNKSIQASFNTSQRSEETIFFDPLTGIGNRPHIENKMRTALEDYRAKQVPFGVLFMDIDHFKNFNDVHGHALGDKILRVVANTLRHTVRLTDSCGRWGGEEFVALAFNLDPDGLLTVAEKVRTAISQTKVQDAGAELCVTVSLGATLVRPDDTVQSLVKRADELMYKSKGAGRDQVTVDLAGPTG